MPSKRQEMAPLTRAQRLIAIICISFSFFVAEISKVQLDWRLSASEGGC